jgi:CRP-like cAMP-binding protein
MSNALQPQHRLPPLAQILASHPLLENVDESTLSRLAALTRLRKVPKGTILFMQGDEAEALFVIQQGWIKLFRQTLDGDEVVVDILHDGFIFGDSSLAEGNSYSSSAQAVEPTELLEIPSSALREAVEASHRFSLNLLASFARRRRQKDKEIEHLTLKNAPQRIGCFLLRLCSAEAKGAVTLHLPYDKMLVAARLGMQPETFSRALGRLKEETGVKTQGPSVIIPSIERMIEYTCSACSDSFPCEDVPCTPK